MRPEKMSQILYNILRKPAQHKRLVKHEKAIRREYEKQYEYLMPYSDPATMKQQWTEPYEYQEGTLEYYSDRFRAYHRLVYILRTINHFKGIPA